MNRNMLCSFLAGAAGLLFVGNASAATDSQTTNATPACKMPACDMPACCSSTNASKAALAKAKPDLLTTCPVSGDKLGEMDKPYVFVYKGQEVKLCCQHCKKDFDKNPAKYMAKIRAADKKAKKDAKD